MAPRKKAVSVPDDATSAFQLRLDSELHDRFKKIAEEADVSLNQLIQGILWGTVENLKLGEAFVESDKTVRVEPRKKCLYVGRAGFYRSPRERARDEEEGWDSPPDDKGELWFGLDFTNRGVVRKA